MIDEKKLIDEIREKLYPERFGERCNALDVINAFMQVIDEQPKIGEWIPCSERLSEPAGCEDFIRVIAATNIKSFPVGEVLYWQRLKKFTFFKQATVDITKQVVAWMPLPEPYKEDM